MEAIVRERTKCNCILRIRSHGSKCYFEYITLLSVFSTNSGSPKILFWPFHSDVWSVTGEEWPIQYRWSSCPFSLTKLIQCTVMDILVGYTLEIFCFRPETTWLKFMTETCQSLITLKKNSKLGHISISKPIYYQMRPKFLLKKHNLIIWAKIEVKLSDKWSD